LALLSQSTPRLVTLASVSAIDTACERSHTGPSPRDAAAATATGGPQPSAVRGLYSTALCNILARDSYAKDDPPGLVLLKTQFGGSRIMDMLVSAPLPRIC